MKAAAFLALALLTYYLAGAYSSVPLLVFSGAELLTVLAMFCLSRYFKRKLRAIPPEQVLFGEKGGSIPFRIKVESRGRLAPGRLRAALSWDYPGGKGPSAQKLRGSGGALSGSLLPPYCGLVSCRVLRIRAFDYFGFFSGKIPLSGDFAAAVFPKGQILPISLSSRGDGLSEAAAPSQSAGEFRQLRAYRPGDPIRHIHWNLSARTESLWVKEYQGEQGGGVRLFLDTAGMDTAGPEKLDRFYTLLSALVLGLLAQAAPVRVGWDSPDGPSEMAVSHPDQRRELLLRLYRVISENGGASPGGEGSREESQSFRLDLELGLYWEDRLLCRFSPENLEEEIARGVEL